MATKKRQTQMSIRVLAGRNQKFIEDAFLKSVKNSQESVILSVVSDAVATGDTLAVEAGLKIDKFEAELTNVANGQKQAFKAGADKAHSELPKSLAKAGRTIDLLNPIAANFLDVEGARLVTAVSDNTRKAITSILDDVIGKGVPPLRAAKQLRSVIGLNNVQAGALVKQRELLKAEGVVQSKIDSIIARRTKKMIRTRAKTIARTETIKAVAAGRQRMWDQLTEDNIIDPGAMKQWVTSADELVGSDHEEMDGVKVPIGEEFFIPETGQSVQTPNESRPNCRCSAVIIFN